MKKVLDWFKNLSLKWKLSLILFCVLLFNIFYFFIFNKNLENDIKSSVNVEIICSLDEESCFDELEKLKGSIQFDNNKIIFYTIEPLGLKVDLKEVDIQSSSIFFFLEDKCVDCKYQGELKKISFEVDDEIYKRFKKVSLIEIYLNGKPLK
ncbi:MAG: hypothetical protein KAT32_04180 [Candidatus Moranbacteria bacterium]|nr:hypothetical protein [Candidatus Moranbacteria bacterium]